jgi:lipopolysaccharide transport system permease protein
MQHIAELIQFRELLWTWTAREVKIRYKQSIVGGAWALFQPLSLMLVFTIIFGYIVEVPSDGIPYPVFSYCALLPWVLFASSIGGAVPSLVGNMNLVTKIYFPREILPLAVIGAALLDYAIALALFFVLLLFYGLPLLPTLLYLPLLLVIQLVFTVGIALFAAATTVSYRDVRFVVPLLLQLWFYLTPIIYPLSAVPESLQPLYLLNPMAILIESYRRVALLGQSPQWLYLLIAFLLASTVAVAGYAYFKRAEVTFADII